MLNHQVVADEFGDIMGGGRRHYLCCLLGLVRDLDVILSTLGKHERVLITGANHTVVHFYLSC